MTIHNYASRADSLAKFLFNDRARPRVQACEPRDTILGRPLILVGPDLALVAQDGDRWHLYMLQPYRPIGQPEAFGFVLALAFGVWCDGVISTVCRDLPTEPLQP